MTIPSLPSDAESGAGKTTLHRHWDRLMTSLGLPALLPVRDELFQHYAQPGRHYHNLDHLAHVLAEVDSLAHQADDADVVRLAAWFHDAIYDPRATDNEERSAELARVRLAAGGLDDRRIERVCRLILCTKTHQAGDDADAQVLLDADLSILGAAADVYDRCAAAIRREYAWVPAAEYRAGRRRVLEGFLKRPHIYCTPEAREKLETTARANLRRELASLD